MPADIRLVTADEFMQMHFDVPVELVRGEIVYPYGEDGVTRRGWAHATICQNMGGILWNWCRQSKTGRVGSNDPGVLTERDPDTLRGPDLFYVSSERIPGGMMPAGVPEIAPDLCVEVLSPHDSWKRVQEKVSDFLECGVKEVWVIDPQRRTVHVFQDDLAPRELRQDESLESDLLPGFTCSLNDVFEGV